MFNQLNNLSYLYLTEAEEHEKDILLINQGLSVLRMPVDPSDFGFPIHVDTFMTAVGVY